MSVDSGVSQLIGFVESRESSITSAAAAAVNDLVVDPVKYSVSGVTLMLGS